LVLIDLICLHSLPLLQLYAGQSQLHLPLSYLTSYTLPLLPSTL
jgi:hypothetical protein